MQTTSKTIVLAAVLFVGTMFTGSAAYAQNNTSEKEYSNSYELKEPGITSPVTIQLDNHVYSPGDDVQVFGQVWEDVMEASNSIKSVVIEVRDNEGNVVGRENAMIGSDGKYVSSVKLLDSAGSGLYTAESKIEVEADALGIIQAITSAALRSSIEFVVAEPMEKTINVENQQFKVSLASNSEINSFEFHQQDKKISFVADGADTATGITEITIPKELLSGKMVVLIDEDIAPMQDVVVKSDTEMETVMEINYKHGISALGGPRLIEVTGTNVVPEFPAAYLVGAVAIAGVILAIRFRKNR